MLAATFDKKESVTATAIGYTAPSASRYPCGARSEKSSGAEERYRSSTAVSAENTVDTVFVIRSSSPAASFLPIQGTMAEYIPPLTSESAKPRE